MLKGAIMTKEYEILFIMKPHLSEEAYAEATATFQNWITSTGGEVTLLKPQGLKELATIFDKNTHGYYVQCQFKSGSPTLIELRDRIKVSEVIFRYLIVTLDSIIGKEKPEKPKKAKKVSSAPPIDRPPVDRVDRTPKVAVKG